MEYLLGGVLFALFIAAQALALVAMRPVSMQKSLQSESKPNGRRIATLFRRSIDDGPDSQLSARGRRLLQP
jgi:hypothetical protein